MFILSRMRWQIKRCPWGFGSIFSLALRTEHFLQILLFKVTSQLVGFASIYKRPRQNFMPQIWIELSGWMSEIRHIFVFGPESAQTDLINPTRRQRHSTFVGIEMFCLPEVAKTGWNNFLSQQAQQVHSSSLGVDFSSRNQTDTTQAFAKRRKNFLNSFLNFKACFT
jgi:hypothetical protein